MALRYQAETPLSHCTYIGLVIMKKNKRKGAPKHSVNQNAFACIQVYGLYLF